MIQAEHVRYAYRGMEPVLRDLSLFEEPGRCLAILGNNGAGKSTFLKCLNRILEPQQGLVVVDSMEIQHTPRAQIARKMAYVEQHTDASRLTVFDTVLLGRRPHMRFGPSEADYSIAAAAISRMQLDDLKLRYVDELSGGELQKTVLARALAQQPRVLLLDEPTASLDLRNQHEVMQTVSRIAKEDSITVVVVIHDLNLALKYCDRFLLIHNGSAYSYGDSSIITPEAIRTVYGVRAAVTELCGSKYVVVA
ncbi:MAG: ABC transporter ATP-binding protein [Oscillospiraceae bacterium]|nr:ABC transporter ATP-binding protein [Oscillospiraceae bacterium]